jgi:predicted permease
LDLIFSLIGIYIFILLGFGIKYFFTSKIDDKTLVYVSMYSFQPMLIFWGLTIKKLDISIFKAPLFYFLVIVILVIISQIFAKLLFEDEKEKSIATVAGIIGNTGNLGIPLGIAIYGQESVIYTSMINLINMFIVYSIGVYFYSRGEYDIKESLKNIVKLPAIWVGIFALIYNHLGFSVNHSLLLPLKMGAYSAMALQLIIFGIYLYSISLKAIPKKLTLFIFIFKFLLTPLLGYGLLSFIGVEPFVAKIIVFELITPLAVMNVNLASLYNCKPNVVAFLTFSTSLFFMFYIFLIQ